MFIYLIQLINNTFEPCFASTLIFQLLFVEILLSIVSYPIFIISTSLRIIFPPLCLSCQPCPSLLEPNSTILMDPLYMLLHALAPTLFLGGANLTSPNLLTKQQQCDHLVIVKLFCPKTEEDISMII